MENSVKFATPREYIASLTHDKPSQEEARGVFRLIKKHVNSVHRSVAASVFEKIATNSPWSSDQQVQDSEMEVASQRASYDPSNVFEADIMKNTKHLFAALFGNKLDKEAPHHVLDIGYGSVGRALGCLFQTGVASYTCFFPYNEQDVVRSQFESLLKYFDDQMELHDSNRLGHAYQLARICSERMRCCSSLMTKQPCGNVVRLMAKRSGQLRPNVERATVLVVNNSGDAIHFVESMHVQLRLAAESLANPEHDDPAILLDLGRFEKQYGQTIDLLVEQQDDTRWRNMLREYYENQSGSHNPAASFTKAPMNMLQMSVFTGSVSYDDAPSFSNLQWTVALHSFWIDAECANRPQNYWMSCSRHYNTLQMVVEDYQWLHPMLVSPGYYSSPVHIYASNKLLQKTFLRGLLPRREAYNEPDRAENQYLYPALNPTYDLRLFQEYNETSYAQFALQWSDAERAQHVPEADAAWWFRLWSYMHENSPFKRSKLLQSNKSQRFVWVNFGRAHAMQVACAVTAEQAEDIRWNNSRKASRPTKKLPSHVCLSVTRRDLCLAASATDRSTNWSLLMNNLDPLRLHKRDENDQYQHAHSLMSAINAQCVHARFLRKLMQHLRAMSPEQLQRLDMFATLRVLNEIESRKLSFFGSDRTSVYVVNNAMEGSCQVQLSQLLATSIALGIQDRLESQDKMSVTRRKKDRPLLILQFALETFVPYTTVEQLEYARRVIQQAGWTRLDTIEMEREVGGMQFVHRPNEMGLGRVGTSHIMFPAIYRFDWGRDKNDDEDTASRLSQLDEAVHSLVDQDNRMVVIEPPEVPELQSSTSSTVARAKKTKRSAKSSNRNADDMDVQEDVQAQDALTRVYDLYSVYVQNQKRPILAKIEELNMQAGGDAVQDLNEQYVALNKINAAYERNIEAIRKRLDSLQDEERDRIRKQLRVSKKVRMTLKDVEAIIGPVYERPVMLYDPVKLASDVFMGQYAAAVLPLYAMLLATTTQSKSYISMATNSEWREIEEDDYNPTRRRWGLEKLEEEQAELVSKIRARVKILEASIERGREAQNDLDAAQLGLWLEPHSKRLRDAIVHVVSSQAGNDSSTDAPAWQTVTDVLQEIASETKESIRKHCDNLRFVENDQLSKLVGTKGGSLVLRTGRFLDDLRRDGVIPNVPIQVTESGPSEVLAMLDSIEDDSMEHKLNQLLRRSFLPRWNARRDLVRARMRLGGALRLLELRSTYDTFVVHLQQHDAEIALHEQVEQLVAEADTAVNQLLQKRMMYFVDAHSTEIAELSTSNRKGSVGGVLTPEQTALVSNAVGDVTSSASLLSMLRISQLGALPDSVKLRTLQQSVFQGDDFNAENMEQVTRNVTEATAAIYSALLPLDSELHSKQKTPRARKSNKRYWEDLDEDTRLHAEHELPQVLFELMLFFSEYDEVATESDDGTDLQSVLQIEIDYDPSGTIAAVLTSDHYMQLFEQSLAWRRPVSNETNSLFDPKGAERMELYRILNNEGPRMRNVALKAMKTRSSTKHLAVILKASSGKGNYTQKRFVFDKFCSYMATQAATHEQLGRFADLWRALQFWTQRSTEFSNAKVDELGDIDEDVEKNYVQLWNEVVIELLDDGTDYMSGDETGMRAVAQAQRPTSALLLCVALYVVGLIRHHPLWSAIDNNAVLAYRTCMKCVAGTLSYNAVLLVPGLGDLLFPNLGRKNNRRHTNNTLGTRHMHGVFSLMYKLSSSVMDGRGFYMLDSFDLRQETVTGDRISAMSSEDAYRMKTEEWFGVMLRNVDSNFQLVSHQQLLIYLEHELTLAFSRRLPRGSLVHAVQEAKNALSARIAQIEESIPDTVLAFTRAATVVGIFKSSNDFVRGQVELDDNNLHPNDQLVAKCIEDLLKVHGISAWPEDKNRWRLSLNDPFRSTYDRIQNLPTLSLVTRFTQCANVTIADCETHRPQDLITLRNVVMGQESIVHAPYSQTLANASPRIASEYVGATYLGFLACDRCMRIALTSKRGSYRLGFGSSMFNALGQMAKIWDIIDNAMYSGLVGQFLLDLRNAPSVYSWTTLGLLFPVVYLPDPSDPVAFTVTSISSESQYIEIRENYNSSSFIGLACKITQEVMNYMKDRFGEHAFDVSNGEESVNSVTLEAAEGNIVSVSDKSGFFRALEQDSILAVLFVAFQLSNDPSQFIGILEEGSNLRAEVARLLLPSNEEQCSLKMENGQWHFEFSDAELDRLQKAENSDMQVVDLVSDADSDEVVDIDDSELDYFEDQYATLEAFEQFKGPVDYQESSAFIERQVSDVYTQYRIALQSAPAVLPIEPVVEAAPAILVPSTPVVVNKMAPRRKDITQPIVQTTINVLTPRKKTVAEVLAPSTPVRQQQQQQQQERLVIPARQDNDSNMDEAEVFSSPEVLAPATQFPQRSVSGRIQTPPSARSMSSASSLSTEPYVSPDVSSMDDEPGAQRYTSVFTPYVARNPPVSDDTNDDKFLMLSPESSPDFPAVLPQSSQSVSPYVPPAQRTQYSSSYSFSMSSASSSSSTRPDRSNPRVFTSNASSFIPPAQGIITSFSRSPIPIDQGFSPLSPPADSDLEVEPFRMRVSTPYPRYVPSSLASDISLSSERLVVDLTSQEQALSQTSVEPAQNQTVARVVYDLLSPPTVSSLSTSAYVASVYHTPLNNDRRQEPNVALEPIQPSAASLVMAVTNDPLMPNFALAMDSDVDPLLFAEEYENYLGATSEEALVEQQETSFAAVRDRIIRRIQEEIDKGKARSLARRTVTRMEFAQYLNNMTARYPNLSNGLAQIGIAFGQQQIYERDTTGETFREFLERHQDVETVNMLLVRQGLLSELLSSGQSGAVQLFADLVREYLIQIDRS